MPSVTGISHKDAVRALKKAGFRISREGKHTPWSPTPKQAIQLQQELRDQVRLEDDLGDVKTVAGVDLKIGIGWKEGTCGIVALSFPELEVIEEYDEPDAKAGSSSPLTDNGETIGEVLRTKTGVRPVFISPGHRISFRTATQFTLQCTRGYRIPEPTRLSHLLVTCHTGPSQLYCP